MQRLCLNMIVKNESAILERCLESVSPYISSYVIGDTGSTDGTQDLIKNFFDKRNIPGEVYSFPFENFSQARNSALELCRKSKQDFEYVLLSDADMELVVEDESFSDKLNLPSYLVKQVAGISYDNVRIVKRDLPAKYIGATHEYLDTCSSPQDRLEGIHFIDHAAGSSRSEKSERDVRFLLGDLAEDPDNARAMFYLAQTYKDLGQWKEAGEWYQRRIQAGGFQEEIWYAAYMRALCLKNLGDEAGFVHQALATYQLRPSRSETLLMLSTYYREKGQSDLALLMTRTGLTIPFPKGDRLFVEDFAYQYGFLQEMSITGFYSNDPQTKRVAYDACMRLSIDKGAPCWLHDVAARNTVHYAKSGQEAFGASFKTHLLNSESPVTGYAPMNPSVWRKDGRLFCNVRWVNYRIDNGSYVVQTSDDNVIRTENEIVEIDLVGEGLVTKSYKRLVDVASQEEKTDFSVQGYEDCRLFFCRGRWWASATVRDRSSNGLAEIVVLELVQERDETFTVKNVYVQRAIGRDVHEKNWVPLVDGQELFFIYSTDPTVVLQFDFETMQCRETSRLNSSFDLRNLRGSSQAIHFEIKGQPGWLYVTHEAFVISGRWYTHRLVWMSSQFQIEYVSQPFYFIQKGIEFCAGLTYFGQSFVFSFGVGDAQAWIATVDQKAVEAWLTKNKNPELGDEHV